MNIWLANAFPWWTFFGTTPLEILATLAAISGVFLIARQNVLGWPLGMLWAGISAWLAFFEWRLISDAILYLSYLPIQAWCWWCWKRGGENASARPLRPTWLAPRQQAWLALAAAGAIVVWALSLRGLAARVSWLPDPDLLWRDSASTVLNYFAQILQARKRMENWLGWLLVNLLGIHIYWVKEAPVYSLQYGFFLLLGCYGWLRWRQSMRQNPAPAA